jgi:2'-phosphotransferase
MEKRKDRNDADVKLSKALSWLLRHGAEKEGVKVNADGYAKMEDVLNYMREQKGFNTLKEHHILHIVDTNDKKRF